jgi:perosamine synthetase
MSNLQAAVEVAQLERLDEFIARKRRMLQDYNFFYPGLLMLKIFIGYTVLCSRTIYLLTRKKSCLVCVIIILGAVRSSGQSMNNLFFERWAICWGILPHSRKDCTTRIDLPSGLGLTDEQIGQVAHILRKILL